MICCVEDDASIRELIVYTLQNTGFEARGFADGNAFFKALPHIQADLVLLDVMLPGEDGIRILKRLRASEEWKRIPVIMTTAKGTEYDKVVGLESGADDYLAKPFGMMELVSRIRAVLRRTGQTGKRDGIPLAAGEITLDPERRRVTAGGEEILLTRKEFDLLHLLMENRGIVLSRDKLLESIWGYDFDGETRTVDVHIRTLRQKLGVFGEQIETIRGVGYRIGGAL